MDSFPLRKRSLLPPLPPSEATCLNVTVNVACTMVYAAWIPPPPLVCHVHVAFKIEEKNQQKIFLLLS